MDNEIKNNSKLHDVIRAAKKYVISLRDIRNVGTLAFVLLVFIVSWNGLKAIQLNFVLEKKMVELERSNELKKLANDNLRLTNKYYETNQYLEITARQNLGMALPGESILLVPKEVAMRYVTPMPDAKEMSITEKKIPLWERNFESWINFFLHRGLE